MDQFENAYRARQSILTEYFGKGEFSTVDVSNSLDMEIDMAYRCCKAMVRDGEMEVHGRGRKVRFVALTAVTMTSDKMRDRANHRDGIPWKPKVVKEVAGRYVHEPGKLSGGLPIKNPDAMHSGRSRVYVGSSADMV